MRPARSATFSLPIVPSRGIEVLCFLVSLVALVAMLCFLGWAASVGLTTWLDALLLWLVSCVGGLPLAILGAALRWHRHRKEAALREYERILALAYQD
jgi:hypothetical protein